MDRITCLSYLLYQVDNDQVKRAALYLLVGDTSIKELKKDVIMKPFILSAEKLLKKTSINKKELMQFVENAMFVH